MPLSPGATLGRYEILAELGRGSMGVVYRARDTRLERDVAIKLLPAEMTTSPRANERFLHEARAVSALDHPNICTIHEIDETPDGQLFMVMAFYEGQTLKHRLGAGALPVDEAVDLATQIGRGLAQAHAAGIVHRDIKPANVMVTTDRIGKLLDFGLAKLLGSEEVTQPGTMLGTVAYMSPEQALGQAVDERTDVWATGVVLYEMLTGVKPFPADTLLALATDIVRREPDPVTGLRPEVPTAVGRVVARALAKTRTERYRSGAELTDALTAAIDGSSSREEPIALAPRVGGSHASLPSIAVLPFADMSPGRDQAYFCEGMADEVINALSKVEGLRVAARTSSFRFGTGDPDLSEIGARLQVDHILTGSVRTAGARIRVRAELVSAADGFQVWSERFDRDLEDVFSVQDEIARSVVDSLKLTLLQSGEGPLVEAVTDNLRAYQLYLQGRYHWYNRSPRGMRKAMDFFHQALEEDASFGRAHAGIAQSYAMMATYAFAPPAAMLAKARTAADQALASDPNHSEVHAALGLVRMLEYDWDGSEAAFRRALELDPLDALGRGWFAWLLANLGRFPEAISEATIAVTRDPLAAYAHVMRATALYLARRYEQGVAAAREALALDPSSVSALFMLGGNLGPTRRDEAISVYEQASQATDRATLFVGLMSRQYGLAGRSDDAESCLRELLGRSQREHVDPVFIAYSYIGIGATDQALEWLERAFAGRSALLVTMLVGEAFDPVRDDPRFTDLIEKMRFPPPPART